MKNFNEFNILRKVFCVFFFIKDAATSLVPVNDSAERDSSVISINSDESSSVIYVETTFPKEEKADRSDGFEGLCAGMDALCLQKAVSSTPKKVASGATEHENHERKNGQVFCAKNEIKVKSDVVKLE